MNENHATVVVLADRRVSRELAAVALYDAECALHAARASQVDSWIRSAGDRLHEAVTDYLAAVGA